MAITTTWTSPAEGGSLDLSTGGTIIETIWEGLLSNINYLGGTGGYGAYHRLAGTSSLAAPAGSVDFASIPAGYGALQIVIYGRCNGAGASQPLNLRFNGDTANNYDWEGMSITTTTVTGIQTQAQAVVQVGALPAAAADGTNWGIATIMIPGYDRNGGAEKLLFSNASMKSGTTSGAMTAYSLAGHWRSTAAINQITVIPAAGSISAAASLFIYGLPA